MKRQRVRAPKPVQETTVDGPYTFDEAVRIALSGRRCQWAPDCNQEIEPKLGSYWEHIRNMHKPTPPRGKHTIRCQVSGCSLMSIRLDKYLSMHLDNHCHRNDGVKVVCWDPGCRHEWRPEDLYSPERHLGARKHSDERYGVVGLFVPLELPREPERKRKPGGTEGWKRFFRRTQELQQQQQQRLEENGWPECR